MLAIAAGGLAAPWVAHAAPPTPGVTKRLHYVRDGSFAEDASRIRCNPGIFARLRLFAANILRFNNVHNVTDARHRIAFGGLDALVAMRFMN